MKQYIGTKIIQAEPASQEGQEGYAVQYADGYQSWSPRQAFDEAYRPCEAMTFGLAIEALKKGFKVARAGWNGKGMWLTLSSPGGRLTPSWAFWSKHTAEYAASQEHLNGHAMVLPCITKKTATGEILMGWLASQTDMLAEDWQIVE